MTELIEPMNDVSPVRQVEAQIRGNGGHAPTFTEVVYAHHRWWRARQSGTPDPATDAAYDAVLTAFEAQHGRIVRAYWCSEVESAVALTERRRWGGLLSPVFGFHRESDWATKTAPAVASELHNCDELAVRANAVLTGVRKRICLELVVACASHLLSLVDTPAAPGNNARTAAAVEHERVEIKKVRDYYCDAANGQAQLIYFGGIATVMLILAALGSVWLSITWATPVAALIGGAIGAVVSVVQRINSGSFELDYDVGGPYIFFLGGLRPLIGGAFAVAISFAFDGGLLHLPVSANETTGNRHLALLVISFLAGFSERFAQDTLTSVLPEAKSAPAPTPAASPSSGPAPAPAADAPPERSTS
ncbi:MAG TPA: hypothetical protein VFU30_04845 [Gaiellaceae bacterium]|nr:hypothetical protein [Gaiellaceae bacterium]